MTPFSDFLFEFNDFSCLKMHCIKMIFFMRLDKSHISRTQTRKIENNQIWNLVGECSKEISETPLAELCATCIDYISNRILAKVYNL